MRKDSRRSARSNPGGRVRYAVVGLGYIAQVASCLRSRTPGGTPRSARSSPAIQPSGARWAGSTVSSISMAMRTTSGGWTSREPRPCTSPSRTTSTANTPNARRPWAFTSSARSPWPSRCGTARPIFNSLFTLDLKDPENIRLQRERGGGTLWDIGIYCINAARYLFQDEVGGRKKEKTFPKTDQFAPELQGLDPQGERAWRTYG
jgi:hypothetical protein